MRGANSIRQAETRGRTTGSSPSCFSLLLARSPPDYQCIDEAPVARPAAREPRALMSIVRHEAVAWPSVMEVRVVPGERRAS